MVSKIGLNAFADLGVEFRTVYHGNAGHFTARSTGSGDQDQTFVTNQRYFFIINVIIGLRVLDAQQFGGVQHGAAANADDPGDIQLFQILNNACHHFIAWLAVRIIFIDHDLAGQVQRFNIVVIGKFVGEKQILPIQSECVYKFRKGCDLMDPGMHGKIIHDDLPPIFWLL